MFNAQSKIRRVAVGLLFGLTLTVLTAFVAPMFGDEIAEYVGGVSVVQAEDCSDGGSC